MSGRLPILAGGAMMSPPFSLEAAARALGGEVKASQVLAPGPNHSAADRSLSIKLDGAGPEGFLVHSFAGDDPVACKDYVRKKLGLPSRTTKGNGVANGGAWELIREHIYRTADGVPHVRKRKMLDHRGKPQYPQSHWFGDKWVKNLPQDWPKVLYRLPELLGSPKTSIAYVTEGERDADTLAALGFVAATAGGVSSTWTPELAEPLKGRRVVILVDADKPGRAYGEKVARSLDPVAESVKVVDLYPERDDGSDVSTFIATDRAGVRFIKAVNDAPEWEQSAEAESKAGGNLGDDDDKLITELAAMPRMKYERERKAAAERLGVRASILDRLVADDRAKHGSDEEDAKQGRAISFPEPEAWPGAVDGADLLDEIEQAIGRHLVMPEQSRHAAALWIVHSYLLDRFFISPRLAICSPIKRCGKTTLLDVIARMVTRPLPTANVTSAALFRIVETCRPTLLVDEADTFIGNNDELRGVLNSGHRRGGSVLRTVGENHEPRSFSTYAACAIALIGKLPETLADRSVSITLKRRLRSEPVEQFRPERAEHLDDLARKAARWAQDHARTVAAAEPDMPAGVFNRAADNWRPLIAIADVAGGVWPERARSAAVSAAEAGDAESRIEMLLGDIRTIFAEQGTDRLPSADLVAALVAIEGQPWAEYGRTGKPISQNQLARVLKGVGIFSENIRVGDKVPKGYLLERLGEAFDRYLPSEWGSKPLQRCNASATGTSSTFQSATPENDVAVEKCEKSLFDGLCSAVAGEKGEIGEREQSPSLNGGDVGPGVGEWRTCDHCGLPGGNLLQVAVPDGPLEGVPVHRRCVDAWFMSSGR